MPTAEQFAAGSLAFVALVAVLMWYFGSRLARTTEKEGKECTADDIRRLYGSKLLSGEFLWGVWLGRNTFDGLQLVVRNHRDEEITTIHNPSLPTTSSIHYFDWQQARYGANPMSLFGDRTAYSKQGDTRVLYTSKKKWVKVFIWREDTDVELCTVHVGHAFSKYSRITRGDMEIGRIISQDQRDTFSPILSVKPGALSELEQLIVLMALM